MIKEDLKCCGNCTHFLGDKWGCSLTINESKEAKHNEYCKRWAFDNKTIGNRN